MQRRSSACLLGDNFTPLSVPVSETMSVSELHSLNFNVFDYTPEQLGAYTILMLDHLGSVDQFEIPKENLNRFVEAVRSKYQENPYHNWYHGVAVMHFSYLILCCSKAINKLTQLDALALLVASLCHDVDHPGFNNDFQIRTSSPLALLHNDSSVLENHHAYVTFQLLRKPGLDIFANLKKEDTRAIRSTIIKAVIATDMSHHKTICMELDSQAPDMGSIDPDDPKCRLFLVKLICHSSDLAGQCAPLHVAKQWMEMVALEFTRQAKEEDKLSLAVTPHMQDLENTEICYQNHVNFIDFVMIPLWAGVCRLIPELNPCQEYLSENRKYFFEQVQILKGKQAKESISTTTSSTSATTTATKTTSVTATSTTPAATSKS